VQEQEHQQHRRGDRDPRGYLTAEPGEHGRRPWAMYEADDGTVYYGQAAIDACGREWERRRSSALRRDESYGPESPAEWRLATAAGSSETEPGADAEAWLASERMSPAETAAYNELGRALLRRASTEATGEVLIEGLELTVHSYNTLKRAGVHDVGPLLRRTMAMKRRHSESSLPVTATPVAAVPQSRPRESRRAAPGRHHGSRRVTGSGTSSSGESDDPGESKPGSRSGRPLLFLVHPRYGRVNGPPARFLEGAER
jgi:hypothetical protein